MAEHYENLEKALCKELEKLDKKYAADVEMSETDLERAKDLYKALYYGETHYAMKEAAEWDGEDGAEGYSGEGHSMRRGDRSYLRSYSNVASYARYRSPRTGRFVSRDMEPGYSNHYPMEYIDPYWDRRY